MRGCHEFCTLQVQFSGKSQTLSEGKICRYKVSNFSISRKGHFTGIKAFPPWTKTNQAPKATLHWASDSQSSFSTQKVTQDAKSNLLLPSPTLCSPGQICASCLAPSLQCPACADAVLCNNENLPGARTGSFALTCMVKEEDFLFIFSVQLCLSGEEKEFTSKCNGSGLSFCRKWLGVINMYFFPL